MSKNNIDTKGLVTKIAKLTKERIAKKKVVSLQEFRQAMTPEDVQTLLLIEDDETLRKAMRRIFEEEGFRVITAADGTQLSVVLDDSPIDLIILDVGLPWINGYELAKLMKEHEDLKWIPLVFVSGRNSKEDIKKGFAVGADDFITKPFQIDQLTKSVKTLLKLHK